MPVYKDQLQRTILLDTRPKRIVSLVPSQTELLYDLGLDAEVIGITKFCVHPANWFNTKTRIGGTKNLHIEKIKALRPDLILANKEENVQEQIEALASFAPVWVSDVNDLAGALSMIEEIGMLTGKAEAATAWSTQLRNAFALLEQQRCRRTPIPTAYLIWKDPYMTVGGDTFISSMMAQVGLLNVFHAQHRYPEITVRELQEKAVSLILLASEPYPFQQKHIAQLQAELPGIEIRLTDGEMFSWYGSRMLKAAAYFNTAFAW